MDHIPKVPLLPHDAVSGITGMGTPDAWSGTPHGMMQSMYYTISSTSSTTY